MSGSRSEGYDRLLTIFSPDGHLYQIEYAFKSVNSVGITSVGVKGANACVVATQRKVKDKMIDPASVSNVFKITNKIGCVLTGPIADCRSVASRARQEAAQFHYDYGYPIPVSHLAKRIADLAQQNTQYAGRRTMAVVSILVAVEPDNGPQLFRVDLAGSYFGYSACSAGVKEQEASSLFEKRMKERGNAMDEKMTIQTAIEVLQTCVGADFKPAEVEVGITATNEDGTAADFRTLGEDEIEHVLGLIAERD